jgi:hypothetical protein
MSPRHSDTGKATLLDEIGEGYINNSDHHNEGDEVDDMDDGSDDLQDEEEEE